MSEFITEGKLLAEFIVCSFKKQMNVPNFSRLYKIGRLLEGTVWDTMFKVYGFSCFFTVDTDENDGFPVPSTPEELHSFDNDVFSARSSSSLPEHHVLSKSKSIPDLHKLGRKVNFLKKKKLYSKFYDFFFFLYTLKYLTSKVQF